MAGNRRQFIADAVDLLEAPLGELGYELLDVRLFQGGGRLTLRFYLDTADGITIDECAKASRTVAMLIEESTLVGDAYVIEVTSPGIRRPLRTRAHFEAAKGQDIILKFEVVRGTKKLKGRLQDVTDEGLTIVADAAEDVEADEAVRVVGYAEIIEANLDPEFDVQALINADRRRRKDEKKLAREQRRDQRHQSGK